MGIAKTVLLPAGSKYGLAAECGGNDTVVAVARQLPKEYVLLCQRTAGHSRGASRDREVPQNGRHRNRRAEISRGGRFEPHRPDRVDRGTPPCPVLLHFEFEHYNLNLDRFYKILDRHPKVNFIGHAQTWWCNIDKGCDQKTMYPTGDVTPGGITDRLLSDYPNMYGDLSAGSGLNSMLRDEGHAREFLKRHQDKLLFGSDCNDRQANGPNCLGSKIIAAVRRLAPDKQAERKMLYGNASRC